MARKQQGGLLHTGGVVVPIQSVKQLDWNGNIMMDLRLVPARKDFQCLMDASLNQVDITK